MLRIGSTDIRRPTSKRGVPLFALAVIVFVGMALAAESRELNIKSGGGTEGTATLINLNPTINAWYPLKPRDG